jgi:hypothetical protein
MSSCWGKRRRQSVCVLQAEAEDLVLGRSRPAAAGVSLGLLSASGVDAASDFAEGRLTWTMPRSALCAWWDAAARLLVAWVGRGHGRARRPVGTGGRPTDPARDGPAGPPPAAHRGAATTAPSPANQRGGMADRRGRAGDTDDRRLRPWAAWPCRGRDGRRRCGSRMAWRAAGSGAGRCLAGVGRPQLLVGPERTAVGAAAGAAGAAPVPAPVCPGDPCPGAELTGREHRGCFRPAAAAVRRGDPGGLGRLGHALDTGHLHRGVAGGDLVHAGAGGSLAQYRQVGGDGADRPDRHRPHRAGRRRPHRRAGRRSHWGDDSAGCLPAICPERGLPHHLPGGPRSSPGRRWG